MSAEVGIALAVYRPVIEELRAQLASIAEQTHRDWICFLTCDSPVAELRSAPLVPFFDDPRFVWRENSARLGFKDNFASAIALAARDTRYVACADQDDVWYPQKLATLVRAIDDKPPLSVVHADMDVLVDGQRQPRSAWEIERREVDHVEATTLLVRNVVTGASMLMDAELARRFPRIPDEAIFHDHWFAFLASLHGGVHPIHERLHAYRQHGANVIGVRAYRGMLDGRSARELVSLRDDAARNYRARRALAIGAREAGVPLTRFQRLAFTRHLDGGLALAGLGLASLGDRALARECFALAAGKLVDALR